MTACRFPSDDGDRPLRLRPPVLVPLRADQERQAVDALAGMPAGLLARHGVSHGHSCDDTALQGLDAPDDDEAA